MNKLIFSLVLLGIYCFAFSSSTFDARAHFGLATGGFQPAIVPGSNCSKNGCAEYKGTCSSNCSMDGGITNSSCCFAPLFCVGGKCVRHTIGASCNVNNSNCIPDSEGTGMVQCINSTCTEIYGAGDTCTNSSSCVSPLACTNGMCVGLTAGQKCDSSLNFFKLSQCAAPNYCSTIGGGVNGSSVCTAPTTGSCLTQNSICNQTAVCNVIQNKQNVTATCQQIASLSSGALASSPLLCASGLAWNTTACVSIPSGSMFVECNGDTDDTTCTTAFGDGATCNCSTYTGNAFCMGGFAGNASSPAWAALVPTGAYQALNLANCLSKYSCSYNGVINQLLGDPVYNANAAPNACSYVNCWSAYKKFAGMDCSDQEDLFGSCFYSAECGGFPVWAIVVIVIVAVILVLAVVIVIFLVLRRRKDYASI